MGTTLSLDFTFSKGECAHIYHTSDNRVLTLQTKRPRSVGVLDGTGFLVDRHGHPSATSAAGKSVGK